MQHKMTIQKKTSNGVKKNFKVGFTFSKKFSNLISSDQQAAKAKRGSDR